MVDDTRSVEARSFRSSLPDVIYRASLHPFLRGNWSRCGQPADEFTGADSRDGLLPLRYILDRENEALLLLYMGVGGTLQRGRMFAS
jgi:hypothetical protein